LAVVKDSSFPHDFRKVYDRLLTTINSGYCTQCSQKSLSSDVRDTQ